MVAYHCLCCEHYLLQDFNENKSKVWFLWSVVLIWDIGIDLLCDPKEICPLLCESRYPRVKWRLAFSFSLENSEALHLHISKVLKWCSSRNMHRLVPIKSVVTCFIQKASACLIYLFHFFPFFFLLLCSRRWSIFWRGNVASLQLPLPRD